MAKKKQTKKKTSNKKIEEIEEIKEEVTEEADSTEEVVEDVKEEKTKKKRKDSKKTNKTIDKKQKEGTNWFKGFKAEIKKIVWPSGKKLFDNVVVVISMVLVVTLIIFLLDLGLKQLSNLEVNGINELKTKVANELNSTSDTTTSEDVLVNGTDGSVTTIPTESTSTEE